MIKVTTENYDEVFNKIHAELKETVYKSSSTLVKAVQDTVCMIVTDCEGFDDVERNDIIEKIRSFNVGTDYVATSDSRLYSKILVLFYVIYCGYTGALEINNMKREKIKEFGNSFGCDILEYLENYINVESIELSRTSDSDDTPQYNETYDDTTQEDEIYPDAEPSDEDEYLDDGQEAEDEYFDDDFIEDYEE